MPTSSIVPQDQAEVRPERHTGCPSTGAAVPMILASGPAWDGSFQVLAAGCGSSPAAMEPITATSVPTLPGLSSSPTMLVLPGPPNWLNPKVPNGPAGVQAGNSRLACSAAPSSEQCPAVRTDGRPAGLNAENPVEQISKVSAM